MYGCVVCIDTDKKKPKLSATISYYSLLLMHATPYPLMLIFEGNNLWTHTRKIEIYSNVRYLIPERFLKAEDMDYLHLR